MAHVTEHELSWPVRHYVTPVETTLRVDHTLAEALASLRSRKIEHKVIYFFVLDGEGRLVGVMPTRKLLLSDPADKIEKIMESPVISLPETATLEMAMELFAMHRLLALPVVDGHGRLKGTVDVRLYAEGVGDLATANRDTDIFQLIGLRGEELRHGSPWRSFRARMPWLTCNVAAGLICALIALYYAKALEKVTLLAMFFPLVLTLSESIAMQSMTMTLQYLHGRDVPWRTVRQRAGLEVGTAVLLGLCCGMVVAVGSLFWGGGRLPQGAAIPPAALLGVCIAGSMTASSMFGLGFPVLLHAVKLDPKVASGPVALMVADVVTTLAYLGLATWWLV